MRTIAVMKHTSYFAYCGSGGGALGFQRASIRLFNTPHTFRVLGGFDIDPNACDNFRYLTGASALCIDARKLTPDILRKSAQGIEPDVVFGSAPCVGATKLITDELASTPHYAQMNELVLVWTELMLATWRPKLIIYENVPNIVHRAKPVIAEVMRLMRRAGYLGTHEDHELGMYGPPDAGGSFYDAGALGGLAQRRKRWLALFRDPKQCSPLTYKPPKRRIRGVGEVIGPLPLPDDPAGGPMHKLPKLSVLNLIRLALIPAGGDWRDLPGVLGEEQKRRELFRREHLARWDDPSVTVGGPGSNGPHAVADPRVEPFDIQVKCQPHAGAYGVTSFTASSSCITGAGQIDNANQAVADPRVSASEVLSFEGFKGVLGVIPWSKETTTITGESRASNGSFSVADVRVPHAFNKGYAVVAYTSHTNTIAGGSDVGCGTYAVSDPRISPPTGWLTVDDIMVFLETPGPWAIIDRTSDGPPLAIITDLKKPPPIPLRIVARDGTWHRPFTVYELGIIQGLPAQVNGAPLQLTGPSTVDRKQIGNLVPPPAAQAIAERFLVALGEAQVGSFSLSGAGGVWVENMEMALQ